MDKQNHVSFYMYMYMYIPLPQIFVNNHQSISHSSIHRKLIPPYHLHTKPFLHTTYIHCTKPIPPYHLHTKLIPPYHLHTKTHSSIPPTCTYMHCTKLIPPYHLHTKPIPPYHLHTLYKTHSSIPPTVHTKLIPSYRHTAILPYLLGGIAQIPCLHLPDLLWLPWQCRLLYTHELMCMRNRFFQTLWR